jgi:hypothetical protein
MPLWATERSNLTVADYAPLWGIIDVKYEDSEALHTRRKESLWLPAANTYGPSLSLLFDSMPAGAHLKALTIAYNVDSMLTAVYGHDYSGLVRHMTSVFIPSGGTSRETLRRLTGW